MNLSRKAYNLIREEIITCILSPGQQINQGEIAKKLQMGITPVREALTRLAHEGLVTVLPRYGYLVSPITLTDLNELFEYRVILETAAVKMAAQKASDQQILALLAMADFTYHYKEIQDHTKFLNRNAQFHSAVATLANNRRLSESLSSVLDELTRFFHIGLNLRDSADEMRTEHMDLARALQERDESKAEDIVRRQIDRSRQRIIEALQTNNAQSSSAEVTVT
ncbi:MAG: GntR family transcriptional regulator [Anaerolineae bacterium]|nr:GntR family transcriptional regulator [Anaerolineae bacterium]